MQHIAGTKYFVLTTELFRENEYVTRGKKKKKKKFNASSNSSQSRVYCNLLYECRPLKNVSDLLTIMNHVRGLHRSRFVPMDSADRTKGQGVGGGGRRLGFS